MHSPNVNNVVPLAMPSAQLRKRAAMYRKRRQPLTALDLLRRAMEQDDSTAVRLELAETLLSLSNFEQASELLYRTLSRPDAPADAWMLLARAQTSLGNDVAATDCLYRYLALDMFSDQADLARDMLASLDEDRNAGEPSRLTGLGKRAVKAWQRGHHELALRRMKRSIHLARHTERQYLALVLLAQQQKDFAAAYRYLARALRKSPNNPHLLSQLCITLHAMGRKRVALAMLRRCASVCQTPTLEGLFFSVAWSLGAQKTLLHYLKDRLRQMPCRASLLYPTAILLCGRHPTMAARLLLRALHVDPADQRFRICLRQLENTPEKPIWPDAPLPAEDIHALLGTLLGGFAQADALHIGSQTRMLADWFFSTNDLRLQSIAYHALVQSHCADQEDYLRELLTAPSVLPPIRQKALLHLYDMGVHESLPMLTGQRMVMSQYTGDPSGKKRFSIFLALFLRETRQYGQSMPMAFYAASLWRRMSPIQRTRSTANQGYATIKAMELRYLLETHQKAAAERMLSRVQISERRIFRVMRSFAQLDLPLKGDFST